VPRLEHDMAVSGSCKQSTRQIRADHANLNRIPISAPNAGQPGIELFSSKNALLLRFKYKLEDVPNIKHRSKEGT